MKKIILILTILLGLTIIAGCGQQDCSLKDTTYEKYSFNSNSGQCEISHKIQENVCGNKIVEDKETYCNCPSDVSKLDPDNGCSGTKGNFLEKACNDNTKTCDYYQNKKVVNENKILEFKNSRIIIHGNVNLKKPFILNTADDNKVEMTFSLFNTPISSQNIKNLMIKDVSIENSGSVRLADHIFNKDISKIGSKTNTVKIKLADTTKLDSKENLKIKMNIAYTVEYLDSKGEIYKTENKIETLTSYLGQWEIINPNFY